MCPCLWLEAALPRSGLPLPQYLHSVRSAKYPRTRFIITSCLLQTSVGYDGDVYFTIVANGIIHAIMYTYYLLTLFNIRPA